MAEPYPIGKSHIDLLRSLAEKGADGDKVNSESAQFKQTRRHINEFMDWFNVLFDQHLVESVPEKTQPGWYRITDKGRRRLAESDQTGK